jgi:hypothetical protein
MKLKARAHAAREELRKFRNEYPGELGPLLVRAGEEFMTEPDLCKLCLFAGMFLRSLFSGVKEIGIDDLTNRVSIALFLIGVDQLHKETCPMGQLCRPVTRLRDPELVDLVVPDVELVQSFFTPEILTQTRDHMASDIRALVTSATRPETIHLLSIVVPIIVVSCWSSYSVEIKLELAALLAMLGKVHSHGCSSGSAICNQEWEVEMVG